jgi:hypothetical protein
MSEPTTVDEVTEARLRYLVPADQPVTLITQMPRSGGTLLLGLLDGHPECHVMPHELGATFKAVNGLESADDAWARLRNARQFEDLRLRGYRRRGRREGGPKDPPYPFLLPERVQRTIFESRLERYDAPTDRDYLDSYLTSYFNGWLDNRNLHTTAEKRWVVMFEPGEILRRAAMERFFELYPDGRVVSLVRDPRSWWASAREWSPRWHELDAALVDWLRAARETRRWKAQKPESVFVVPFEKLLREPRRTMRAVAGFLGIEFRRELFEPTFNGLPVRANSSFADPPLGVSEAPVDRHVGLLTDEELATIGERAGEAYARLVRRALK